MELDARTPLEILFARIDHPDSTCSQSQRTEIMELLLGLPASERNSTLANYFESENQRNDDN